MDQKKFEEWLDANTRWHRPMPRDPRGQPSKPIDATTGPEITELLCVKDQPCEWCKKQSTDGNSKTYVLHFKKNLPTHWSWKCDTCHKKWDPITEDFLAKPELVKNKIAWYNEGPVVVMSEKKQ